MGGSGGKAVYKVVGGGGLYYWPSQAPPKSPPRLYRFYLKRAWDGEEGRLGGLQGRPTLLFLERLQTFKTA